jgi:hypothetical protein
MDTTDHPLVDHVGYFVDPVALGSQAGLVVISRLLGRVREMIMWATGLRL